MKKKHLWFVLPAIAGLIGLVGCARSPFSPDSFYEHNTLLDPAVNSLTIPLSVSAMNSGKVTKKYITITGNVQGMLSGNLNVFSNTNFLIQSRPLYPTIKGDFSQAAVLLSPGNYRVQVVIKKAGLTVTKQTDFTYVSPTPFACFSNGVFATNQHLHTYGPFQWCQQNSRLSLTGTPTFVAPAPDGEGYDGLMRNVTRISMYEVQNTNLTYAVIGGAWGGDPGLQVIDISDYSYISLWAKASANGLVIRFGMEITGTGQYTGTLTCTTSWQNFIIPLNTLGLPSTPQIWVNRPWLWINGNVNFKTPEIFYIDNVVFH